LALAGDRDKYSTRPEFRQMALVKRSMGDVLISPLNIAVVNLCTSQPRVGSALPVHRKALLRRRAIPNLPQSTERFDNPALGHHPNLAFLLRLAAQAPSEQRAHSSSLSFDRCAFDLRLTLDLRHKLFEDRRDSCLSWFGKRRDLKVT